MTPPAGPSRAWVNVVNVVIYLDDIFISVFLYILYKTTIVNKRTKVREDNVSCTWYDLKVYFVKFLLGGSLFIYFIV